MKEAAFCRDFSQIGTIFGCGNKRHSSLTIDPPGLAWNYHLRSQSGSNGPIAKEESPLLGWRPILIFPGIDAVSCGGLVWLHVAIVVADY
jgi:hypothetical protein